MKLMASASKFRFGHWLPTRAILVLLQPKVRHWTSRGGFDFSVAVEPMAAGENAIALQVNSV